MYTSRQYFCTFSYLYIFPSFFSPVFLLILLFNLFYFHILNSYICLYYEGNLAILLEKRKQILTLFLLSRGIIYILSVNLHLHSYIKERRAMSQNQFEEVSQKIKYTCYPLDYLFTVLSEQSIESLPSYFREVSRSEHEGDLVPI